MVETTTTCARSLPYITQQLTVILRVCRAWLRVVLPLLWMDVILSTPILAKFSSAVTTRNAALIRILNLYRSAIYKAQAKLTMRAIALTGMTLESLLKAVLDAQPQHFTSVGLSSELSPQPQISPPKLFKSESVAKLCS
jgi:hypothetical protein